MPLLKKEIINTKEKEFTDSLPDAPQRGGAYNMSNYQKNIKKELDDLKINSKYKPKKKIII